MQTLNGKGIIEFEDFQLDMGKNVVRRNGELVPLPLKAVELLSVLVENRGDIVSKEELMSRVWAGAFVEDSVLTQNVYLLRKTLNSGGPKNLIKTVPRRGYFFNGEIRETATDERATVVERHVVERISIDVSEEQIAEKRNAKFVLLALAAALGVLFSIGAVSYLYRGGSKSDSPASVPPLRIKPPTSASGYRSLAVTPFSSPDAALGRSFANELSTRLGSFNKFGVRSQAQIDEYTKHGVEFTVDYVLSGSVGAADGRFSANVTFANASGTEVWSDQFEFDNPVQLQDAIANRTLKEITARLSEPERELVSKRLPSNLSAYQSFQAGYALWRRRADGSAQLNKAIELDRSFAPAYAILANISATAGIRGSKQAQQAEELLQKAFSLDENLADAYAVQGFIRIFHHHDWAGAETSLRTALALDPNNVNARHWMGVFYSIHRRLDEAKEQMNLALTVDPTNPTLLADLGQVHYFSGELETARNFYKKALAIAPDHVFATEYLNDLTPQAGASDAEALIGQLEQTPVGSSFSSPYLNVDPKYDPIRDDTRFKKLLSKINLP